MDTKVVGAIRLQKFLSLAIVTMLLASAALAQTSAHNSLFSIVLPPRLTIETDKIGTLLASGSLGIKSSPFLIVYFCAFEPGKERTTRCDSSWRPLVSADVREFTSTSWDGIVATSNRGNGVTEWRACVAKPQDGLVTCIRRLRSATGYIDLRYLSDGTEHQVNQTMEAFVAAIRWR